MTLTYFNKEGESILKYYGSVYLANQILNLPLILPELNHTDVLGEINYTKAVFSSLLLKLQI